MTVCAVFFKPHIVVIIFVLFCWDGCFTFLVPMVGCRESGTGSFCMRSSSVHVAVPVVLCCDFFFLFFLFLFVFVISSSS